MTIEKPSETRTNSKDNGLLTRSLSSVRSLIGLQLVSRLFTFVLNQGLVRLASAQAYGTVAVQFELIMSTILFLSREGIRNSLLRVWPQQKIALRGSNALAALQAAQCTNLATLPALLGLPITLITVTLYTYSVSESTRSQPHFYLALFIYSIAAVGELLSEPLHNRLGISVKSIVTYLCVSELEGELALLAFALGQLAYSAAVFVVYASQMPESSLWPSLVAEFFDPDVLYLSMTMTSQSVVKHFLTEGDKFLVSLWSPLQDQGGYAIAVNYGSLIARILFQPIEEEGTVKGKRSDDLAQLKQASDAVTILLSVQIAFSLLVVTFGSLYIPVILQLLLPTQYISTSAPKVLSAWIWYIPVLAINGGLEAFYSSVATPEDLHMQSRWMLGFSALYILSATALYNLGFGDTSLVYANIVNLTARIWYTAFFILAYFGERMQFPPFRLADLVPKWKFLVIVGLSYVAISYNEARQHLFEHVQQLGRKALLSMLVLSHLALGGGLGLVCVGIWWMTEGKQLISRERIKVA
ncbi:Rft-1-domain-containing protein [Melanogaster broomeanus]|nr:Rft-1-domain-containing protein [Melanogaster broomeanus]